MALPADQIIAIGRNPEKIAGLSSLDVVTRMADYGGPVALEAILAGVETLLFVSGTDVGARQQQHRKVVDAAAKAGVGLIAYSSVVKAGASAPMVTPDHLATETYIQESGRPSCSCPMPGPWPTTATWQQPTL